VILRSGRAGDWRDVTARLDERFRTLLLDGPATDPVDDPAELTRLLDDVQLACHRLVDPALLVGRGPATRLALEAAAGQPAAIAGVACYEPEVEVHAAERYRDLALPVLLLDGPDHPARLAVLARVLPAARTVVLPAAGRPGRHPVPAVVAEVIGDFAVGLG
jgi:hypothetical protein